MAEFKYQKICRLSRCQKPFGTNLDWQEFCRGSHRVEYHNLELKDISKISDRVKALEDEMKSLKRKRRILGDLDSPRR